MELQPLRNCGVSEEQPDSQEGDANRCLTLVSQFTLNAFCGAYGYGGY